MDPHLSSRSAHYVAAGMLGFFRPETFTPADSMLGPAEGLWTNATRWLAARTVQFHQSRFGASRCLPIHRIGADIAFRPSSELEKHRVWFVPTVLDILNVV